jgi:hypothetical protein
MQAESRLQSMDGTDNSNCFFPPDLGRVPEWSPFITPDVPQQHHPHVQVQTGMHDPKVWQPSDFVRRPDDSSMNLCTAHISPYSEVPDDISYLTVAVEQDTCKIQQVPVELAEGTPSQHRSDHVRTSHVHKECRVMSMQPQHNPFLTIEAHLTSFPRISTPKYSQASCCSVSGPQDPARNSGRGLEVQPITCISLSVTIPVPPQVVGASVLQSNETCAAEKVGALHTAATQASLNPIFMTAYAPYPRPPPRVGGSLVKGNRHSGARDELFVHVQPFNKQPLHKTQPHTIWDASSIPCISFVVLLGLVVVVLLLFTVFK